MMRLNQSSRLLTPTLPRFYGQNNINRSAPLGQMPNINKGKNLKYINGLAALELNGKWGFLNQEARVQIPVVFDKVSDMRKGSTFSGYIERVESNLKDGVLDERTVQAFEPDQYYALVTMGVCKNYVIDEEGRILGSYLQTNLTPVTFQPRDTYAVRHQSYVYKG